MSDQPDGLQLDRLKEEERMRDIGWLPPHSAEELVSNTCCDNPSPRVGVKSGRMFCGNCRQYLDAPPPPAEEPEDTESDDAQEGDDHDDDAG